MKPSQNETALKMLRSAGSSGVRSDAFYAAGIMRGPARIEDLIDQGYEIRKEREGKYARYVLVSGGGPMAGHRVESRGEPSNFCAGAANATPSPVSGQRPSEVHAQALPASPGPSPPEASEGPARLFEEPHRSLSAFTDAEAA